MNVWAVLIWLSSVWQNPLVYIEIVSNLFFLKQLYDFQMPYMRSEKLSPIGCPELQSFAFIQNSVAYTWNRCIIIVYYKNTSYIIIILLVLLVLLSASILLLYHYLCHLTLSCIIIIVINYYHYYYSISIIGRRGSMGRGS